MRRMFQTLDGEKKIGIKYHHLRLLFRSRRGDRIGSDCVAGPLLLPLKGKMIAITGTGGLPQSQVQQHKRLETVLKKTLRTRRLRFTTLVCKRCCPAVYYELIFVLDGSKTSGSESKESQRPLKKGPKVITIYKWSQQTMRMNVHSHFDQSPEWNPILSNLKKNCDLPDFNGIKNSMASRINQNMTFIVKLRGWLAAKSTGVLYFTLLTALL